MKITAIIMLTACIAASATGKGQGITLSVKDAPIDKVFTEIKRQTGYSFVYANDVLAQSKPVSLDLRQTTVEEALKLVFHKQPLIWNVVDKVVVVKVKPIAPGFNPEADMPQGPPTIDVRGRVVDTSGTGVPGASVVVKGDKTKGTSTDANGYFELKGVDENAVLVISGVNIESYEIKVGGRIDIGMVTVRNRVETGTAVVITGNTGYQVIDKKHPGSFDVVGNELLNRRVGPDILSRIENLTTGISFKNVNDGILIRGRSSIFSNVSPLIVLDNFPYDGDINNINPNDVESITILKDAASAAQWGARAGNGVIVITTKRGRSIKPQISFNSNLTIQDQPDLFSLPIISSSDYIDFEKTLFDKGYYNIQILNPVLKAPLSPAVEILVKKRNGIISPAQADAQLNELASKDSRTDLTNYFYQKSLKQQYSLNVSGISGNLNYYLSGGIDRSRSNLVGATNNRVSLRSQNLFRVSRQAEIEAGINYIQQNGNSGSNPGYLMTLGSGKSLYPYADLVDNNGNGLNIVRDFRSIYTDTAGNGNLLNWKYNPYNDINTIESANRTSDFLLNLGARYRLSNFLNVEIKYQYENSVTSSRLNQSVRSYYTRDLINRFYQPNAINKYPVPIGDILDVNNSELVSHQGRFQVNYRKLWNRGHELSAFSGWEIRDVSIKGNGSRIYGYNREGNIVYPLMDYVTKFPKYNNINLLEPVPYGLSVSETLDRFISYFINATYSYKNKFSFSGSARNDAANLFGVKTNQKAIPLWSIGGSWNLSNERFYKIDWLPMVKARFTYGYRGNYSRATSAYTTARYGNSLLVPSISASIINPPNENLRWEQNRILNVGLDFSLKNEKLSGSIEYYAKTDKDLMGIAPSDPTLGVFLGSIPNQFNTNIASLKGHGFEVRLDGKIVDRKFKWNTTFLFTYFTNRVSEYLIPVSSNSGTYVSSDKTITPIVGQPIYTLYGYGWAGLDATNGDPLGVFNKVVSKDYVNMINNSKLDELIYKGQAQPPYYGGLLNSFQWQNFSFSFNISYKAGYYFRRSSVGYNLLATNWTGHSDYSKRWQKPGDELATTVPSFTYPINGNRDQFYAYSEVLIERGDHVRLEDARLDFTLKKSNWKKSPFSIFRTYIYANNLGVLWKANKAGIDPYFINSPKIGKSISIGLNATF